MVEKTLIRHAVAAIVVRDGLVLAVHHARRGGLEVPGGKVGGLWYPDPKVETDAEALARELEEECALRVQGPVHWLGEFRGNDFVCRFYLCDADGEPTPGGDVDRALFVSPEDLQGGTGPRDYEMACLALRVVEGSTPAPVAPASTIRRERQAARRSVLRNADTLNRERREEARWSTRRARERAPSPAFDSPTHVALTAQQVAPSGQASGAQATTEEPGPSADAQPVRRRRPGIRAMLPALALLGMAAIPLDDPEDL